MVKFALLRYLSEFRLKSFIVLIIGNSKSFHLGAQGTFNPCSELKELGFGLGLTRPPNELPISEQNELEHGLFITVCSLMYNGSIEFRTLEKRSCFEQSMPHRYPDIDGAIPWPIQDIVLFLGSFARINTIICAPTL